MADPMQAIGVLERRVRVLEDLVEQFARREGVEQAYIDRWRAITRDGERHAGDLLEAGSSLTGHLNSRPERKWLGGDRD